MSKNVRNYQISHNYREDLLILTFFQNSHLVLTGFLWVPWNLIATGNYEGKGVWPRLYDWPIQTVFPPFSINSIEIALCASQFEHDTRTSCWKVEGRQLNGFVSPWRNTELTRAVRLVHLNPLPAHQGPFHCASICETLKWTGTSWRWRTRIHLPVSRFGETHHSMNGSTGGVGGGSIVVPWEP